jgi:glutamate racemase
MAAIGVFDSGVGGISVLGEAMRELPQEEFIYYGDNKNAPYGDKTDEQILALTLEGVDKLLKYGVKALVIACNTATSVAVGELRHRLRIPVIGMEPALKPAQALRSNGQIVILATAATLRLPKFKNLFSLYGQNAIPVSGSGLVELIEKGDTESARVISKLHAILDPYLSTPTDAIVLGCTHYVFLKGAFRTVCPNIPLIDGNGGTIKQLINVLKQKDLLSDQAPKTRRTLLSSDERMATITLMEKLLAKQAAF